MVGTSELFSAKKTLPDFFFSVPLVYLMAGPLGVMDIFCSIVLIFFSVVPKVFPLPEVISILSKFLLVTILMFDESLG